MGCCSWNIFGGFQFVAFFIYLMAAYAETNRAPFDLPEAETELVAGYHTEYSSMKFAMFFMAEYANMITVGCVATLLFFGGASSPFGHLIPAIGGRYVQAILPVFWFVAKVFGFLALYIWVRATLPRFRYDQLMSFGWKFLLPLAMANIIVTSFVLRHAGHSALLLYNQKIRNDLSADLENVFPCCNEGFDGPMQLALFIIFGATGCRGSIEPALPAASHQQRAVAGGGDDVAGGAVLVAGRGVSGGGAGDRVLGRHYGAVRLRHHAAERGRRRSTRTAAARRIPSAFLEPRRSSAC